MSPHFPLTLQEQDQTPKARQSHLWGCNKGMGLRVCVIAASEVPVVGGDDSIFLPLLDVFPASAEGAGSETWPGHMG